MTYRISTVADVTGIPRNTLLAWERRYSLVLPTRHKNGYRSYSDKDIATILRIKNAMAAGLRVSEAVELLRTDMVTAEPAQSERQATNDFSSVRAELTRAVTEYRREEAEEILRRLLSVAFPVRFREVLFPVLREIRALRESRMISIAQDQYASAIFRSHLASLLLTTGSESPLAPHAVTTTFSGDPDELVALGLAVQLGAAGFRVSYLGAGPKAGELVDFARRHDTALVCVSCTQRPPESEFCAYLNELSVLRSTRWVVFGSVWKTPVSEGIVLLDDWTDFSPDEFTPALGRISGAALLQHSL